MTVDQQSYHLVADVIDQIADSDRWVVLGPHEEFKGVWLVEGFGNDWRYDLNDFIGPYHLVSPAKLSQFIALCKEHEYKIAFFEDPTEILDEFEHLSDPPPFEVHSDFPNTVRGLLPFQVVGFNMLKDLPGGIARWDTGTGKTVLGDALIRYHLDQGNFDLCLFVVKARNRVNTQRSLQRMVDIDALVAHDDWHKREDTYLALLDTEEPQVLVTNYEKIRDDFVRFEKREKKTVVVIEEWAEKLFRDRRILIIWDEMPTKLSNRETRLYHAVVKCLYRTNTPAVNWEKKRPGWLRQYMFSATPIENDPEDWLNCVRILDPRIYGTVSEFQTEYVKTFSFFDSSRPETWHKLDKLIQSSAHIVHQVDQSDPEIAKLFPKVHEEDRYIDFSPRDRTIYDKLTKEAASLDLEEINPLALITVLRMLCDAPTMVANAAAVREAYEAALEVEDGVRKVGSESALQILKALGETKLSNDQHTKLAELRAILTEEHPNEKVCVFSAFNSGLLPILAEKFDDWGVTYVYYDGTTKQMQKAEDAFRNDPSIRIFLSSDKGSDSLNLQVASVAVNYDLPWKWTTKKQRRGRVDRVTSEFTSVKVISLLMADSVEDRMQSIIERKHAYHKQLFEGAVADLAETVKMTKDDLRYILSG